MKLHTPPWSCAADSAKTGIVNIAINAAQITAIEYIKNIDAKSQTYSIFG